jgi:hypothetical protein
MSKVATVRGRLERYADEIETLQEQVGHWSPDLSTHLRETEGHLRESHKLLVDWPANVEPPRKPPERAYEKLKVGDSAIIADRSLKNTPMPLRGNKLEIVAIDGDLVTVKLADVQYGVEKKALRPVEA